MSTRCQIGFYENNSKPLKDFSVLLYRHSDGYPSGVLPDIMPFLEWWSKGRGIHDIEYCSARLLQYMCNQYDDSTLEFSKQLTPSKHLLKEVEETKKYTGTLGHGICNAFHWDIEYLYAITPDGVVVFETSIMNGEDIDKGVKKIGTIPFERWETSKDYKKLTTDHE